MIVNKICSLMGSLVFLAAPALPVAKDSSDYQIRMMPIDNQKAITLFNGICVENYLDKSMLAAKLINDIEPWMPHRQKRESDVSGMIYFESRHGEIGYINYPKQRLTTNDPACHFTFIAGKNASHKGLVALATEQFALQSGKDTTSKKSRQMRWDFQNVGGTPARIFVTTSLKANGRVVSRLSISKHRMPKPAPSGQIT